MAQKKIYQNYLFDDASAISGVTAVHITDNALLDDQAVRLIQLTTGLAAKQDTLSAGSGIGTLTGDTVDVLFDDVTIGVTSNILEVKDGGIDELQLSSNVDAETFSTTAHSWVANSVVGGTIQATLEQIDAAVKRGEVTIAAGSTDMMSVTATATGTELSVKQLLITDTTVDVVATGITDYVASNYTGGTEHQEGDVIILTASASEADRAWIHNGGIAGDETDFVRLTSNLSAATVRGYFSGGAGVDYNIATGKITADVDGITLGFNPTGDTGEMQVLANGINSTHINWAIGSTDADDIPVIDTEADFTGSTVEEVLHELQNNITVAGQLETLAETLAVGNVSGGFDIAMTNGDVIKAVTGGGQMNLSVGGADVYDITTDNGAYGESWVYGDTTVSQIGYGAAGTLSAYVDGIDIDSNQTGDKSGLYMTVSKVVIKDDISVAIGTTIKLQENSVTAASSSALSNNAVFIGTGAGASSSIAIGLDNTVVVAGKGIVAKTADTLYTNQASFQLNGNLFDTIVKASVATQDNVATIQDASGTIAYLSDIASGETLAATLVLGNTTEGQDIIMTSGDVIKSNIGSSAINLHDGGDGQWSITSNNGYSTGSAWTYGQVNSGSQLAYQISGAEAIGIGVYTDGVSASLFTAKEIVIQDNSVNSVYSGNDDRRTVFVGSKNTTMFSGVTNTVTLGGVTLSAKTNNTAYMNQASFQLAGNFFDTIVKASAATQDNVATIQNASGTIAYLSDIVAESQDLNAVLTIDNTTGGLDIVMTSGDVIASALGDNQIAMDVAGDILISSDGGLKAESWYLANSAELQLGFADTGSVNIDNSSARLRQQPTSGGQSEFSAFDASTFMAYETTGATVISIDLSEAAGTVTDDVNLKGLVYADDYKANFTANSLITKTYADAVKTSAEYTETVTLVAGVAKNINHALASTVIHVQLWDSAGLVPDLQITRVDANNITLTSNTGLSNIECNVTAHA